MRYQNKRGNRRTRNAADVSLFEQALLGHQENDKRRFDPANDRKTLQLCRQVERAVSFALAGECGEEILREVMVESAHPMGGAGHLLIAIRVPVSCGTTIAQVQERLLQHSGRIRTMVARAICRKRVPVLSFVALPAEQPTEGGSHE